MEAEELGGEGAGGSADTVVEDDDVLGGEGLGQTGEVAVPVDLDTKTESGVGGGQRVVQVPAHEVCVGGILEDLGRELVFIRGEGLVGEVVVVAPVEPALSQRDQVSIVAGVDVDISHNVGNNLSRGDEAIALLPAGEAILVRLGEQLTEEVVALENVATTVLLEVNDELGLAGGEGGGVEVLSDLLELGRAVAGECGQDDDGDVLKALALEKVAGHNTVAGDDDGLRVAGEDGSGGVGRRGAGRGAGGRAERVAELSVEGGAVYDAGEILLNPCMVLESDFGAVLESEGSVGALVDVSI